MSDRDAAALHRLLYRSRSAIAGADEAVEARVDAILRVASANNARDDVTGALLFSSSVFLQALEGPLPALEAAFERICRDPSHYELEIIEYGAVTERAFGSWSMRRLTADAPVERLLIQLGEAVAADVSGPDLAAQAVRLMATLAALEQADPAAAACAA